MRTVLVTGGKGFLGSHIVRRLCDQGQNVRVFARRKGNGAGEEWPEVVWGDIRDYGAVDRAMKGVEAVIHLVSNFRKGGSDRSEAYETNVEGTKNVLKAAFKHDVERVVHCSTIGVHGDVKQIPADEETEFNPGDLYQSTKLVAEQSVWEFHRETGLPVTVVRPISIYGPGDRRLLKLFRMIKKGRFVLLGSGSPYFHPAYIDDVVEGFVLCLTHERAVGNAFIIGGEDYLPLKELVRVIAEELNVPPPRYRFPLAPVHAAAWLSEMIFVPLGMEPPLHRRRISFFRNSRAFRVDKAKRLLGYRPRTPLREGLKRTIGWYESRGWL